MSILLNEFCKTDQECFPAGEMNYDCYLFYNNEFSKSFSKITDQKCVSWYLKKYLDSPC